MSALIGRHSEREAGVTQPTDYIGYNIRITPLPLSAY